MIRRLLFVISCIILAGALAGCGADDYAIEKQYWEAQKQAEKIFKNPHASPPKELERAASILESFSQKYPKHNLAVEAQFTIGRLYIVKEEYGKARTQLSKIIDKYKGAEGVISEAIFLTGNSYQIQDKWEPALGQYKRIMNEYPLTPRGLDIPVYVAQYYKTKYQPDKMKAAYEEAISHYAALAAKYPGSPLAYVTDTAAANCYAALSNWQNAAESFNAIAKKYKGKVGGLDSILINAALIYAKELKDKPKAKEILERLITDYPKSRLIKNAKNILKELNKNE